MAKYFRNFRFMHIGLNWKLYVYFRRKLLWRVWIACGGGGRVGSCRVGTMWWISNTCENWPHCCFFYWASPELSEIAFKFAWDLFNNKIISSLSNNRYHTVYAWAITIPRDQKTVWGSIIFTQNSLWKSLKISILPILPPPHNGIRTRNEQKRFDTT